MAVEVVKATQAHISAVGNNLRQVDIEEVWASSLSLGPKALQGSFKKSSKCWTVLADGDPILCFGVASLSVLNVTGSPWLLSTDGIENLGFRVVRQSKKYVAKMMKGFERLENWVDERNEISKRWLKWCGFTLEQPSRYGALGKPFHRFWKIKGR